MSRSLTFSLFISTHQADWHHVRRGGTLIATIQTEHGALIPASGAVFTANELREIAAHMDALRKEKQQWKQEAER